MKHSAGGKVSLPLLPGVRGHARFAGNNDEYRYFLCRDWGDSGNMFRPYALFIGMNPSTAEGDVDDPTIRREMDFTHSMGYDMYVKTNVMDWRATSPKDVPLGREISDINTTHIRDLMFSAGKIVMAFGKIDKKYIKSSVWNTVCQIRAKARRLGKPVYCLGTNKDGSPKHPLYLRKDAPLVVWDIDKWCRDMEI